jgi:hypothetical protein
LLLTYVYISAADVVDLIVRTKNLRYPDEVYENVRNNEHANDFGYFADGLTTLILTTILLSSLRGIKNMIGVARNWPIPHAK